MINHDQTLKLSFVLALQMILAVSADAQWKPGTYEDRFVNAKGGIYEKDNNVWVYTSSFAKRFGMPSQWVDDRLQGAEAVAYRVVWSDVQQCGFFGDKNNCRKVNWCLLDLYLTDHDSEKLLWRTEERYGFALQEIGRSARYLQAQDETDDPRWDEERGHFGKSLSVGLESVNFVHGPVKKGDQFANHGPLRVMEYNRDYFTELDYIQLSGCLIGSVKENVRIWFTLPQPEKQDYLIQGKGYVPGEGYDEKGYLAALAADYELLKRGKVPHEIALPDAYMVRVNAYDAKEFQPKSLGAEVERRLSKPKIESEKKSWWKRLFED